MTIHRGSTRVIQTAEERRECARASAEAAARAVAEAEQTRRRLLVGKTISDVQHPEDSPNDSVVLTFTDGSRVRIEPSEWLDITEEK